MTTTNSSTPLSEMTEATREFIRHTEYRVNRIRTGGARGTANFGLSDEQKASLEAAEQVLKFLMGDLKPKREARAAVLAAKALSRAEKDALKEAAALAKAEEREALKAAKAEMKLAENTAKMEAKLAADALKDQLKEEQKAAALEAKKAAREQAEKVRKEMMAKFEARRAAIIGTANIPGIDPATATTPIRRTKTGIETASVPKGKMQAV